MRDLRVTMKLCAGCPYHQQYHAHVYSRPILSKGYSGHNISHASKLVIQQQSGLLKNLFSRSTLYDHVDFGPEEQTCSSLSRSAPLPDYLKSKSSFITSAADANPKEKTTFINGWSSLILFKSFLPLQYPRSVHHYYAPFCSWLFFQSIIGNMISVLSTQALLLAMGLSANNAITSAVALQWVIKDALGQFGGIITAGLLGPKFDVEAKRLRFISITAMYMASFLEILTLNMPFYFLIFASMANLAKNISWIISSATRASLLMQFTKRGHLGDLTAKSASQSTAAGLIGTSLGIVLSNYFEFASYQSFISAYFPLACLGMFGLYKSASYIICNSFTRQRLDILLENTWHRNSNSMTNAIMSDNTENQAVSYDEQSIFRPDQVSIRERFVPFSEILHSRCLSTLKINASLKGDTIRGYFLQALRQQDPDSSASTILYAGFGHPNVQLCFYLWVAKEASSREKIYIYFKIFLIDKLVKNGKLPLSEITRQREERIELLFNEWIKLLELHDWNVDSLYIPEMDKNNVRFIHL